MSTRPGILSNVGTGTDAKLTTTQRDYAGNLQFNQNFKDGVITAYERAIYFQLRPGLIFNSLFTVKGGTNTTNPGQPIVFYFWRDIKRVNKPLEQTVDPAHTSIGVETLSIVPNEYGNSLAITEKLRMDTFISSFDRDLVKLIAYNMEDSLEEIAIDHMVGINKARYREANPFFADRHDVSSQLPSDNTNADSGTHEFAPGRPMARSAVVKGKIVGAMSYGLNDSSTAHKNFWKGIGFKHDDSTTSAGEDQQEYYGVGAGTSHTNEDSGFDYTNADDVKTLSDRGIGTETAGAIAENDEFNTTTHARTEARGMLKTDTLKADYLRQVLAFFQKNNVSPVRSGNGAGPEGMGGWYVSLIHPDSAYDLFTEDGGDNTWLAMAIRQDKASITQNTIYEFAGFQMIPTNRAHIFPAINPRALNLLVGSSGAADADIDEAEPIHGYTTYFFGDEGWARAIGLMPKLGQAPITDTFWRFRALTWYTYMGWDRFRKVASHMLVHAATFNSAEANPTVPKVIAAT